MIKTCAFACRGWRIQARHDMKVANHLNASGRGEGNNVSPSNHVFFLYKFIFNAPTFSALLMRRKWHFLPGEKPLAIVGRYRKTRRPFSGGADGV